MESSLALQVTEGRGDGSYYPVCFGPPGMAEPLLPTGSALSLLIYYPGREGVGFQFPLGLFHCDSSYPTGQATSVGGLQTSKYTQSLSFYMQGMGNNHFVRVDPWSYCESGFVSYKAEVKTGSQVFY